MNPRRGALGLLVSATVLLTGCSGSASSPGGSASPATPALSAAATTASTPASMAASTAASMAASSAAQAAPSDSGYPAVTADQATRIGAEVTAALGAVTSRRSLAAAAGRVSGPMAEQLGARLRIAGARKSTVAVTCPDLVGVVVLAPPAGPWPRTVLLAGRPRAALADATAPLVCVLVSPAAAEPYALWGELTLLPGASLPAPVTSGAAPSATATGTGLAMAPADVAARYADLLTRGSASPYVGQFTTDVYRTQLDARLTGDRNRTRGTATVTAVHKGVGTPTVLPTADGGALVLVQLRETYQATVEAGEGSVQADPDLAALAGRSTFSRRIERTAVEVLAFAVPQGAGRPVRLVAAHREDVAATGR